MKPEQSTSKNPARITVVVVDDDLSMRTLVSRTLQAAGYEVCAVDGPQAARGLIRTLIRVDVLLTDVAMPDGPGSDLVAEVRQTHPETRSIYMSSYSPDELLSYGVDGLGAQLLSKPFSPAELLAKLREVLES